MQPSHAGCLACIDDEQPILTYTLGTISVSQWTSCRQIANSVLDTYNALGMDTMQGLGLEIERTCLAGVMDALQDPVR